jgi:hypothetical protein
MEKHTIIAYACCLIGIFIFFYYDLKDKDMHKFGGFLAVASIIIELLIHIITVEW